MRKLPFFEYKTQSLSFQYLDYGKSSSSGRDVLFLHGFPDGAYTWHNQATFLSALGHRVVCPQLPGYRPSASLKSHTVESLADWVFEFAEHVFSGNPLHLVGHDWGGVLAIALAQKKKLPLQSLCLMNTTHPQLLAKNFLSFKQLKKSWYLWFFQIPKAPEVFIGQNPGLFFEKILRPHYRPHESIVFPLGGEHYLQYWQKKEDLIGPFSWYRECLKDSFPKKLAKIEVPTYLFWGGNDLALENNLVEKTLQLARNSQLLNFPHCGHFLHHEVPHLINGHLEEIITSAGGQALAQGIDDRKALGMKALN